MTKKISMVAALALSAVFGLAHCGYDPVDHPSTGQPEQARPRPEPRPDPKPIPQPEPKPPAPGPTNTGDPPPPHP